MYVKSPSYFVLLLNSFLCSPSVGVVCAVGVLARRSLVVVMMVMMVMMIKDSVRMWRWLRKPLRIFVYGELLQEDLPVRSHDGQWLLG